MIPQPQFNERSKNQIKSNKEIPSSPAASSLLPLPTQAAALESIKEMGAEQLCPYPAKHKVKQMKYVTHSAFAVFTHPLKRAMASSKGNTQWCAAPSAICSNTHQPCSHSSCGVPPCPWARLSIPCPNATAGTSKAQPTAHGNTFSIPTSLSPPITQPRVPNAKEHCKHSGGSCSPLCPTTPGLGRGPEVPGHGRARSLQQHMATKEPPLLPPALPTFCLPKVTIHTNPSTSHD